MMQIPDAAVVRALVSALRPFSDMAGELFAKNYNNDDVVFSVTRTTEKGTKLTYGMNFEAFANAREAINIFGTITNEGAKPVDVPAVLEALTSGITSAIDMIYAHEEKYHDFEDATPKSDSIARIRQHLLGALIHTDEIRGLSPAEPAQGEQTGRAALAQGGDSK